MTKKNKTKRIKTEKFQTEEQKEIIRFIRILVIIVVLVIGVYLFTRIFITKDLRNNDNNSDTVVSGQINYDKTLIGAMLNKLEKEYYVIIYDRKDLNSVYYGGLINTYQRNENALKIYLADLGNELNKKYIADENENINLTELGNFKVKSLALIKVSNGKISKTLSNEEDIAKELEYKEETKK